MPTKTFIINASLVLVSVLISLVLIELLLRIDDKRPNLSDFEHEFVLNGASYNLIESKEAIERSQDAILIVGDSFTRGTACGNRQNYPSAFTQAAKRAGRNIHAVNLGIDAAGPISYLRVVQDYIAEQGPPLGLVITLYANDVRMNCWECGLLEDIPASNFSNKDTENWHKLCGECMPAIMSGQSNVVRVGLARRTHMWLVSRFKTYRLVRGWIVRVAVANNVMKTGWGRLSLPSAWRDIDSARFKLLETVLKEAKKEADRSAVPMIIVIYPDVSNLTEGSAYNPIYRKVSRHLPRIVGVQTYSGFDAFLGNPDAHKDMSLLINRHSSKL